MWFLVRVVRTRSPCAAGCCLAPPSQGLVWQCGRRSTPHDVRRCRRCVVWFIVAVRRCSCSLRPAQNLRARLRSWDYRASPSKPVVKAHGHRFGLNCLSFNPYQEYLVAAGSVDYTVSLWDLRNMNSKLHSLEAHTDEVLLVQWAPFNESVRRMHHSCFRSLYR